MEPLSPSIRDLARRVLTVEASSQSAVEPRAHAAVRVCEKLRVHLTRFIGADGFRAIQRRALALARAEIPALDRVTQKDDGTLEGLDGLTGESRDAGGDAAAAIITHLLSLLVTFIGQPITVRLLREAWPDASFGE